MIFSPATLSSPPLALVLWAVRWKSREPSTRNGAINGSSSAASDFDVLLMLPSSLIARSESDEAIQSITHVYIMDCFRLRSLSYGGQVASLALTIKLYAELILQIGRHETR